VRGGGRRDVEDISTYCWATSSISESPYGKYPVCNLRGSSRRYGRDERQQGRVGIGTGYPRVFQGYPDPYPPNTLTRAEGEGICRLGSRVSAGQEGQKTRTEGRQFEAVSHQHCTFAC
jgi:hypothetical protein